MCGTEVPVFLLLPRGSNIAGWRQQYCWLEAAIGDQPVLYRQMPYAEPTNGVSCTRRNDNYAIQSSTGVLQRMVERHDINFVSMTATDYFVSTTGNDTNGTTRKSESEGVFRKFWPEMEKMYYISFF